MNFVEPIRDRKKIIEIKQYLREKKQLRDLLFIVIGMNTALRVSDLLKLQIGDFVDERGNIMSRFWIREEKRGKRQEIIINDSIRETLGEYLSAYPRITEDPLNFIFFNTRVKGFAKAINRGQAWKILNSICKRLNITGNFGTHTLRKTWGYHARLNSVDLALIMHKFNHNSLAYTKRYLGITDDELAAVVQKLNL